MSFLGTHKPVLLELVSHMWASGVSPTLHMLPVTRVYIISIVSMVPLKVPCFTVHIFQAQFTKDTVSPLWKGLEHKTTIHVKKEQRRREGPKGTREREVKARVREHIHLRKDWQTFELLVNTPSFRVLSLLASANARKSCHFACEVLRNCAIALRHKSRQKCALIGILGPAFALVSEFWWLWDSAGYFQGYSTPKKDSYLIICLAFADSN